MADCWRGGDDHGDLHGVGGVVAGRRVVLVRVLVVERLDLGVRDGDAFGQDGGLGHVDQQAVAQVILGLARGGEVGGVVRLEFGLVQFRLHVGTARQDALLLGELDLHLLVDHLLEDLRPGGDFQAVVEVALLDGRPVHGRHDLMGRLNEIKGEHAGQEADEERHREDQGPGQAILPDADLGQPAATPTGEAGGGSVEGGTVCVDTDATFLVGGLCGSALA